jgi:DNA polymerase I-like protein with 3'-5' exonuclease and polymerase domains
MNVSEAISKMQATALAAEKRLSGYGFVTSVVTDYMNGFYKTIDTPEKARFVTVSVVVSKKDGEKDNEYCMSLGAAITRKFVDDNQLAEDSANFEKMVDEAIETLEKYENKEEGLDALVAKANEEYEKFLVKMEEEQKKSRKLSMISNIIFIVGLVILFIVMALAK